MVENNSNFNLPMNKQQKIFKKQNPLTLYVSESFFL